MVLLLVSCVVGVGLVRLVTCGCCVLACCYGGLAVYAVFCWVCWLCCGGECCLV